MFFSSGFLQTKLLMKNCVFGLVKILTLTGRSKMNSETWWVKLLFWEVYPESQCTIDYSGKNSKPRLCWSMYADIDAVAENITACISRSRFLFYFKNTEILDAVLIELILLTHYTPKVPSYRNSANQLTGFCMMATFPFNELRSDSINPTIK